MQESFPICASFGPSTVGQWQDRDANATVRSGMVRSSLYHSRVCSSCKCATRFSENLMTVWIFCLKVAAGARSGKHQQLNVFKLPRFVILINSTQLSLGYAPCAFARIAIRAWQTPTSVPLPQALRCRHFLKVAK
jgi:hypothetical protein